MSGMSSILLSYGSVLVPPSFGWNPLDKDAAVTLSNSDLRAEVSSIGPSVRGVTGRPATGHYYFEVTSDTPAGASNGCFLGIGTAAASLSGLPGTNADSWALFFGDGRKFHNNIGVASGSGQIYATATLGVEINNGVLSFKYLSALPSGNGTIPGAYSGVTGTLFPMFGQSGGGGVTHRADINTGQSPFAMALPSGAAAWN